MRDCHVYTTVPIPELRPEAPPHLQGNCILFHRETIKAMVYSEIMRNVDCTLYLALYLSLFH